MATEISTENAHMNVLHPLEPLTPAEITAAVALVRAARPLSPLVRFVTVTLKEPAKQTVLAYRPGSSFERRAFLVLLDKSEETTAAYELVVNLTTQEVESWEHIPGVQPNIMLEELFACEAIVKADPHFQEVLARRGITDLDLVYIDPWSAGNYGLEEEQTRRLLRTTVHMRTNPADPNENSYAHPIQGLHALFDLGSMQVLRVEDYYDIPVPQPQGDYVLGTLPTRSLKPLEIQQPEGPSFVVEGHHVSWDNWSLRLGFGPREGLILYDVRFADRSIFYRAAISEMTVPYGDVSPDHNRQNAFDCGEYGLGWLANALELGCDCLGTIHYFDADIADGDGNVLRLPNAICMHEEDYGILWKHTNLRTGHVEVRRSRRLVISFIATVGIYEYGFFWYLYQDGTIQHEIKLTGIMNIGAVQPGEKTRYGKMLNEQLYAPIHQHFFCFRFDTAIDGLQNSVVEEETVAVPPGPENPYSNAFYVDARVLRTEQEAERITNPHRARSWKVINPNVLNHVGEPVGYQLMAGSNTVLPFAHPTSSFLQRAGFTRAHVWVTPYDEKERYAAGEYPNQHPGGAGLPAWIQANRSIENTEIVLWHTVGVHHAARLEDWPVMPVVHANFMWRPNGFFSQNPSLDVAPPSEDHSCHHHDHSHHHE